MNASLNKNSPLAVAVIGGGFGRGHLAGFLADPDRFYLKGFCDRDPAVVEFIQKNYSLPPSCKICSDYQEILNDPAIDAVTVSLPHHLHETVCVLAAQKGKHILVDKPIARTLAEADHILEAVEKNNVTLMVAFNMRFWPQYQKMHDMISSDKLGRPIYAMTWHNQNFNPPAGANWRSKNSVGGGCVIGSGVHNIDLMRWFFGEPAEVFAYGTTDPRRLDAEVAASISFRYNNGLVVNFSCNWSSHGAEYGCGEWAISGAQANIVMQPDGLVVGRDFGKTIEPVKIDPKEYESMYGHFARCVHERSEPLTNGRDARATLALVLKVYESMTTGRPVTC